MQNSINPLVSVIIPNYNHAQYVGDAIHSVLAQTYHNYEIIVVDDGSTDNSREVIAQFGDQVQYLYQKNAGLSAARNTGIKSAKGSLIGVLDADDMYEPDFLNTLVSVLQENPDADGVYCGYQFVDQENKSLPQIEARSVPSEKLFPALLDGNFLVPESMFVRKTCYLAVGTFDESLQPCADWDMWLRITKQSKILFMSRILTRHRVLNGSMSTDPLKMLLDRLAVLKKHIGDEPIDGGASTAHHAYGRAYLGSCVEYLQSGNINHAYERFQKMSKICPGLLTEVDTFYQLGCGAQPKGSMGDLASLNVKESSLPLLEMMGKLFADAGTGPEMKDMQRSTYAKMYYSLGLLAYGARQLRDARHFFTLAIKFDLRLITSKSWIALWLKSWLTPRILEYLKNSL
jgi:tetratricopeptide (TPR) repeat protein